jgi:hypothetical protein
MEEPRDLPDAPAEIACEQEAGGDDADGDDRAECVVHEVP